MKQPKPEPSDPRTILDLHQWLGFRGDSQS